MSISATNYKPLPPSIGYGFFTTIQFGEEPKECCGIKPVVEGIYANYFYTKDRIKWPTSFPNRQTWENLSHLVIDGFSPNLNKDLHIGHLRNFSLAVSLDRILDKKATFVSLLGLSLGEKPYALSNLLKMFSRFNFFPKLYFDTNLPPTKTSFNDGTEEKAGCMVYGKDQIVMQRSDGSFTYPYYELCFSDYVKPTHYITGAEQVDHFKSLGLGDKHLPMGLILDTNGKKMKSRNGDSYKIQEAVDAIVEKLTHSKCPKEVLAYNILFCNFLMTGRQTNLKFDPDLWSNPNSPGLYITYTYARLCSVIKKYPNKILLDERIEEKDIPLWSTIAYTDYYYSLAVSKLDPVFLAQHTLSICKEINAVYERERILDASMSTLTCLCTAKNTLENLMEKLCIEPVKEI